MNEKSRALHPREVVSIDRINTEQVHRARLTCADVSANAEELGVLLSMLGIGPGWADQWVGPVEDSYNG